MVAGHAWKALSRPVDRHGGRRHAARRDRRDQCRRGPRRTAFRPQRGAATLIADMSATTFCDSAGVSALVRSFRRATASGGAMRLVVGTPAVRRVLALTGVDRLVEVYPSVAASLAGTPGQP